MTTHSGTDLRGRGSCSPACQQLAAVEQDFVRQQLTKVELRASVHASAQQLHAQTQLVPNSAIVIYLSQPVWLQWCHS